MDAGQEATFIRWFSRYRSLLSLPLPLRLRSLHAGSVCTRRQQPVSFPLPLPFHSLHCIRLIPFFLVASVVGLRPPHPCLPPVPLRQPPATCGPSILRPFGPPITVPPFHPNRGSVNKITSFQDLQRLGGSGTRVQRVEHEGFPSLWSSAFHVASPNPLYPSPSFTPGFALPAVSR